MKKLFIIDNKFYDKIQNLNMLINSLLTSIETENVSNIITKEEIIYVNNDNSRWDAEYSKSGIKIIKSISEINFSEFQVIIYSNSPFFSISNNFISMLDAGFQKNTIISQDGYSLSPATEHSKHRFIMSKTKVNNISNISSVALFLFMPNEDTPRFNNQSELVKFLHKTNPHIIPEFCNLAGTDIFSLFESEREYIEYCIDDLNISSVGNYVLFADSKYISKELYMGIVNDLLSRNEKITLELRTDLDINSEFEDSIEEVDGELIVKNNFNYTDRVKLSLKDAPYYDYSLCDGVFDLTDMHLSELLFTNTKYMKVYNENYSLKYTISSDDIKNAKRIAVKRTMGLGDSLLTVPIMAMLKDINPDVIIDFYSSYDFTKYLNKDWVDNFHKIDGTHIFKSINSYTNNYDIILDYDLCYENQTSGGRFFDYYLSYFEPDLLENYQFDMDNPYLKYDAETDFESCNKCTIVSEGSGWKGKEPNIDVFERIAHELKKKNYKIIEPGINRITNYADIKNEMQDFDFLFASAHASDFYIGTDSGISHIFNLFNKPSFIIGGSADPNRTQFNTNKLFVHGKTELLCYGCRHKFKGYKTLHDGSNTFVPYCYNPNQYECMVKLDSDLIIEDLENFLIKYNFSE